MVFLSYSRSILGIFPPCLFCFGNAQMRRKGKSCAKENSFIEFTILNIKYISLTSYLIGFYSTLSLDIHLYLCFNENYLFWFSKRERINLVYDVGVKS